MNEYKKFIKSKNKRIKILQALEFVPDKTMVKMLYKIKTGRKLDLNNPQRYTEKIQYYKLYYKNPIITQCSDKYAVREYVQRKGLGKILNTLYEVYDSSEKIEFEGLPNQVVFKTTNSSGTNIILQDLKNQDKNEIRKQLDRWLNDKHKSVGREWGYYNIKPKIIAEKLLKRDQNNDLPDYKFFCFDGKVFCSYVMIDYIDDHSKGKLGFFDRSFNQMKYRRLDYGIIDRKIDKPRNYDRMVEYAEILSKGFPHVRVDFYNIDGEIVFGEMTFYNASGFTVFEPDEFDYILGRKFKL